MKSQIPEVTLPCDLPTWNMVQEYLVVVQAGVTSEEMIVAMLRIYDICNVSPHVSDEGQQSGVDDHIFDDFKQVIENGFSPRERERFLSRTLPCMARYELIHSTIVAIFIKSKIVTDILFFFQVCIEFSPASPNFIR